MPVVKSQIESDLNKIDDLDDTAEGYSNEALKKLLAEAIYNAITSAEVKVASGSSAGVYKVE